MHKQISFSEEATNPMKVLKVTLKILVFILITGLLFACNVLNKSSTVPGITHVASIRNPRANSIIWSPKDPTKILVNGVSLLKQASQIYILDITTKQKTMLIETDYGGVFVEDWAHDGNQILLWVDGAAQGFSQGGMWKLNTEDKSLKFFSDESNNVTWLPNGDTLVVLKEDSVSDRNFRATSIYLMDIQTREVQLIYSIQENISFSNFSPSPDGRYLVFWITPDNDRTARDLYMLDIQTGDVKQLTYDHASGDPQWSPIGDLIVYVKSTAVDDGIKYSLHIFAPALGCDLEVPNTENALSPTWSPDGKKIAFISGEEIYILDIDKTFGWDIYKNPCA